MNVMASPGPPSSDTTTPDKLQNHILYTYFGLRWGVVGLSALLPVAVYLTGLYFHHQPLQPSISNYYFVGDMSRNWFVGTLCAGGALLYLYKGFSNKENVALNLAGLCAVLTAMVPCDCLGQSSDKTSLHGVFAVSFFLAMAFVCLFCAKETLELSADEAFKKRYRRYYRIIGVLLVVSPGAAFVVSARPEWHGSLIFFVEAFAVWVFAAYWLVKSIELRTTEAEKAALEKAAMRVAGAGVVPAAPPR